MKEKKIDFQAKNININYSHVIQKRKEKHFLSVQKRQAEIFKSIQVNEKKMDYEPNKEVVDRLINGKRINVRNNLLFSLVKMKSELLIKD